MEDELAIHDRVELVSVDSLIPYSNNPKEHPDEQVKKIASSIKNYGWDQPIVIDEDGEIIKGHGRMRAAELLGLDAVPVIRRDDLTDAEKRAARIADNKTAESGWDIESLTIEFEVLQDAEGLDDMEDATGFTPDEVDDYLERVEMPDESDWVDHFDDGAMEPDSSEGPGEDKKHITFLLPESRHEQLMDHLDTYDGGKDDSFIAWMDESLGEP